MNSVRSYLMASSWQAWSALLVLIYLGMACVGWDRTLIPDEIRPLLLAAKSFDELMELARHDIVQTPLSYILGMIWLNIFGHTDLAAKSLALLINIPAIIMLTFLASRVPVTHWRVLAFLFCAGYFRVGSAVNLVRMYGLVVLFTVTAFLVWEEWRKSSQYRWLYLWMACMILAVYSHLSALLLFPVFFLANQIFGPRRWIFTFAAVVSGLALLPWVMYVMPVFLERGLEANVVAIRKSPNLALFGLPFYFMAGEDPGGASPITFLHRDGLRHVLVFMVGIVHLVLVIFAWERVKAMVIGRQFEKEIDRWFVLGWIFFGIPSLILYVFSILFTNAVNARYLIAVLPGYWLLVVLLGHYGRKKGEYVLLGVILPVVVLGIGTHHFENLKGPPLRYATEIVAKEIKSTDIVLCESHYPIGYQVNWEWTRRLGRAEPIIVLDTPQPYWLRDIIPGKNLDELRLKGVNRVWFFFRYADQPRVLMLKKYFLSRGFIIEPKRKGEIPSLEIFIRKTIPSPEKV